MNLANKMSFSLFFSFLLFTVNANASDGATVYNNHCAMCHATGISGAPKKGDAAAWSSRGDINKLLQTALSGKGTMPPKGGCSTCSESDIRAAIEYMK